MQPVFASAVLTAVRILTQNLKPFYLLSYCSPTRGHVMPLHVGCVQTVYRTRRNTVQLLPRTPRLSPNPLITNGFKIKSAGNYFHNISFQTWRWLQSVTCTLVSAYQATRCHGTHFKVRSLHSCKNSDLVQSKVMTRPETPEHYVSVFRRRHARTLDYRRESDGRMTSR